MKETFFRSMTWLHTWVGLLVCWILLLVFFAGTASYYRHEISLWTKPEIHKDVFQAYQTGNLARQLQEGQAYLSTHAKNAKDWRINFPTERKLLLVNCLVYRIRVCYLTGLSFAFSLITIFCIPFL